MISISIRFIEFLRRPANILPLVVLRIAFGVLMLVSVVRFVANGWVETLILQPEYHFTYFGFGWVKPLPEFWMYATYGILALLALSVALGFYYRIAITGFFFLFTYAELIDKTYYLNHYYFISLFSFLLIFLPMERSFSLDVRAGRRTAWTHVPRWILLLPQMQLALVYLFGGIAKLNSDWLLHALPMRIWLQARTGIPVIGQFFDTPAVAYLMSWGGALFDLTIVFWLSWRRSRPFAYLAVVGFHSMTWVLFNIGMFPWIMIACTIIFFDEQDWGRLFRHLNARRILSASEIGQVGGVSRWAPPVLALFLALQVAIPLRHYLYPGELTWTEEGYRFSWNVMRVEKAGFVTFRMHDPQTGLSWIAQTQEYLTRQQEWQMSFQPDMILEFAHHLEDVYRQATSRDVEVYAEVWVSLNGRTSQLLLDPQVDLTTQRAGVLPKPWILHQQDNL